MAKMSKIESCFNCDHRILAFGPMCTKLHKDIPGDAGILPGCPLEDYPVECETLAYREAADLATTLWKRYYKKDSPVFELCDSTAGVISQIDNMVAGMAEMIEGLKHSHPSPWVVE